MSSDTFHQKYSALVDEIKSNAPRSEILLCELVPRADVDVTEYNVLIYDVATNHGLCCIELYTAFLQRGHQLDRYYSKDGIHLSFSGIKRMLGEINKDTAIVADFNRCTYYRGAQSSQNTRRFTPGGNSYTDSPASFNRDRRPIRNSRRPAMSAANLFDASVTRAGRPPCTHCKRTNHVTQDCYYKQTIKGRCYTCKIVGHRQVDCVYFDK